MQIMQGNEIIEIVSKMEINIIYYIDKSQMWWNLHKLFWIDTKHPNKKNLKQLTRLSSCYNHWATKNQFIEMV